MIGDGPDTNPTLILCKKNLFNTK